MFNGSQSVFLVRHRAIGQRPMVGLHRALIIELIVQLLRRVHCEGNQQLSPGADVRLNDVVRGDKRRAIPPHFFLSGISGPGTRLAARQQPQQAVE